MRVSTSYMIDLMFQIWVESWIGERVKSEYSTEISYSCTVFHDLMFLNFHEEELKQVMGLVQICQLWERIMYLNLTCEKCCF